MAKKKTVRDQLLDELIDELAEDCESAEDVLGNDGIIKQLTSRLLNRMLEGGLTDHLGYDKHDVAGHHSGNARNGTSPKQVKTDRGEISLEVPRDRNEEFEPQIVRKHQRRLKGFDDKVISLCGWPVWLPRGHRDRLS